MESVGEVRQGFRSPSLRGESTQGPVRDQATPRDHERRSAEQHREPHHEPHHELPHYLADLGELIHDHSDWEEPTSGDVPVEFRELPSELYELVRRRDRGETLPGAAEPLQMSGARLVHLDLSGLDLSYVDLSWSEIVGCTLRGSRLAHANLHGALVHDVDLTEAELLEADLTGAELMNATLVRAGLNRVKAREAHLYGAHCDRASFVDADFTHADLRLTELTRVKMVRTCLDQANLDDADLRWATLSSTSVDQASFVNADLRSASMKHIVSYRTAKWLAANVHEVDFTGAWNTRRYIHDTNYIDEFRRESKFNAALYWVWWATSDCGRSLGRWTAWTVLIALIYAAIYTRIGIDFGDYETALSPFYFSVVTFTTLGFGDVLPASTGSQIVVISEVILGYISLGGMMSILSDKMARRAG